MKFVNSLSTWLYDELNKQYKLGQQSIETILKNKTQELNMSLDVPANLKAGNATATSYFKFQAFTTALVHDERIRTRIKATIAGNIKRGESAQAFYKAIDKVWREAGFDNPKQLSNSYQTNFALAYGAGQQANIILHQNDFPYWQYSAVNDSRTRPSHKALHGKIFKANDHTFFPPLGFRCRCTAIPLTEEQVGQMPQHDILTPEEKKHILPQLTNNEFMGNKQQKYITWLIDEYKTASPPVQMLINKAVKEIKEQINSNSIQALKQEIKDAKAFAKQLINNSHRGMSIGALENLITRKINLRPSDYKEVIGHRPHKAIYKYLKILHKDIANWEYMGYSDNINGKPWHYALFYKFNYKNKIFYANVGWHYYRGEIVYAIQQTNSSKMKLGYPPKYKELLKQKKG